VSSALGVCTKGRKRGNVTVSKNVYVSPNQVEAAGK
jgi:hypothetical protein